MIDKILIGPLAFEIREVKNLTDDEGDPIAGEARTDQCVLLVEANYYSDQQTVTVFHEVVHLVLAMAGRDIEAEDECLVVAITNGILTTLVRNPRLLQLIGDMVQVAE